MAHLDSRTRQIIDDLKNNIATYQSHSDVEREKLEGKLQTALESHAQIRDSMIVSYQVLICPCATLVHAFKIVSGICLAHLSRRLKGELIVYSCSGVRRCRHRRCRQSFSNMNISEASRPIAIKFYLKHHWGWGKAAWGFGADQFR